jgi:hypothetical protein
MVATSAPCQKRKKSLTDDCEALRVLLPASPRDVIPLHCRLVLPTLGKREACEPAGAVGRQKDVPVEG